MSIYNLDIDFINENLLPPQLRKVKQIAWLKVLGKNLKLFNTFFNNYITGYSATDWDVLTSYGLNDTVTWTNKSIYIYTNSVSSIGNLPSDTDYWTLVQDNFIGCDERVKYNAQKLLFEYALNTFFRVPIIDPQIYITNTITYSTPFVMGNSGALSSTMPINSNFQINFLGNAYTFSSGATEYTIYVPILVFNTLGSSTVNRENAVRKFADKYNLAGMTYTVTTY